MSKPIRAPNTAVGEHMINTPYGPVVMSSPDPQRDGGEYRYNFRGTDEQAVNWAKELIQRNVQKTLERRLGFEADMDALKQFFDRRGKT